MSEGRIKLFLCGDTMTGRGIDQVLPHPCPPRLYEPYVRSALDYVRLAERANGPVPRRVPWEYVWGDALAILERERPDARIANLETSVTTSARAVPKGINYRMHPANVPVLRALGTGCAVLANNHVMDWGEAGLLDTLDVLAAAGIPAAGAGRDLAGARAPAALPVPDGRVLVFACGGPDCGIPPEWAAGPDRPGIHYLPEYSDAGLAYVAAWVEAEKRPGDVAVLSIHWGANWGYDVPREHRAFAHGLIERAGIDLVHGHSSHHPKAVEVHRERLILYGCGEFLDDYEGITGHERFRSELVLAYVPSVESGTGRLLGLEMAPFRIRRFRLSTPPPADREWLRRTMDREFARFGLRVALHGDRLELAWD